MRITVGQLRRIIRETIEEQRSGEALLKEEDLRDKFRRIKLQFKNALLKIAQEDLSPEEWEELEDLVAAKKEEDEYESDLKDAGRMGRSAGRF